METAAQRMQKYLKAQFDKFAKTPFVIPAVIAITAGVYFLVMNYASSFCLSGLIAPLLLLGLLWYLGIKRILKLLWIGALACAAFSVVQVGIYTQAFQHINAVESTSEDGTTLTNGTLTPLYGNGQTEFRYSLTVRLNDTNASVGYVNLIIASVGFPSTTSQNVSMKEESNYTTSDGHHIVNYSYTSTLPNAVNEYYFEALIDGKFYLGADYTNPTVAPAIGPVFKDSAVVAGVFAPIAFINVFLGSFPVYALILLMIWWTRKARRSREEQYKKWEAERAKEEAKLPQEKGTEAKVPSMRQAMGLEDVGTFVCSECGADVPADATVCPRCGEKFE